MREVYIEHLPVLPREGELPIECPWGFGIPVKEGMVKGNLGGLGYT